MNLFDDITPISNNSLKKELLLVYPTGGLGEYYLTKILPDFKTRQIPKWNPKHYNDYITYTTQLHNNQSIQFHYDELFLKNDYIDFDELEKFIATHRKDLDINDCKFCHCHVPPVVITHLYNLKFKKTIFIRPKKNINSILRLKISSCRTLVNDGKLNDMMIEADLHPKDFFLQLFNENNVLDIFEFSDVYELSKQKIINSSDCYEELSFDELLNEDHTHVKNIKLMTDNMLNFLEYET